MLVSCPQCKAKYQLATTIKNAILVCHRCGAEFSTHQPEKELAPADHEASLFEYTETSTAGIETNKPALSSADKETALPSQQVDGELNVEQFKTKQSDIEQLDTEKLDPKQSDAKQLHTQHDDIPHIQLSEDCLLPKRSQTRIWHWLILVLLCISGLGVWSNQKQWLAQPWVRSFMMNIQISVDSSPADWSIIKDNLHSQWIDRQDDSRVLFIDGYIKNRLLSDQTPPSIQISFFDMPNSRAIQTRTIAITEPPSLPTIRHAPYIAPPIDQVPISAGGKRAFTLVIENIPVQALELSMIIATP